MTPKTLREYKAAKALTIKEHAALLGISSVYVSFLLSGQRRPSPGLAKKISEKTGIPILNLLYPNGHGGRHDIPIPDQERTRGPAPGVHEVHRQVVRSAEDPVYPAPWVSAV